MKRFCLKWMATVAVLGQLAGCGGFSAVVKEDSAAFGKSAAEMSAAAGQVVDRVRAESVQAAIHIKAVDPECAATGSYLGRHYENADTYPEQASAQCLALFEEFEKSVYAVNNGVRTRRVDLCLSEELAKKFREQFDQIEATKTVCKQSPIYTLGFGVLEAGGSQRLDGAQKILKDLAQYVDALNEFSADGSEANAKRVKETIGYLDSTLTTVAHFWKPLLQFGEAENKKVTDLFTLVSRLRADAKDAQSIRELVLCKDDKPQGCMGQKLEEGLRELAQTLDQAQKVAIPALLQLSENLLQRAYDENRFSMTDEQRRTQLQALALVRASRDAEVKLISKAVYALVNAHADLRSLVQGNPTVKQRARIARINARNFLAVAKALSAFF